MTESLTTAVRGTVRAGLTELPRVGVVRGLVTVAWASLIANGFRL